jgi:predicted acyl esterase
MDEPMLRVWMPEGVLPQPFEAEWPGRWVAESCWPPAQITLEDLFLGDNRLTKTPESTGEVNLLGAQINGATAGVWCPYGNKFGLPIDQRTDDGLSLCFTSAPLSEPAEILGFPEVRLRLSVDQPNALLAVRLCDVAKSLCN